VPTRTRMTVPQEEEEEIQTTMKAKTVQATTTRISSSRTRKLRYLGKVPLVRLSLSNVVQME